ncbi:MAG TPA: hypothetical protein VLE70_00575 [Anaerolineae bacterium]|jgi:hypothetical protein|nr:hypothetical protein [Anaerolineae bacterium]
MMTTEAGNRSWVSKVGWIILIGMSALLIFAGLGWFFGLPQMELDNIVEYANLDTSVFMQGEPSAFDVITVVARGYGVGYAALGLMAGLVALEGYRNGSRWAWGVMWVLAAAFAALAGTFFLAGESYVLSLGILSFAVIAVVGLLMARKGLV